ncbi:MAG: hypothetical protein J6Y95_06740 [Lachnospiraceae bacterium]|nr:hypothetical protein [Lachnospiraceae bacterium]
MMTLDEVITGIREEMGLGDPVLADALHYLKEYRSDMLMYAANQKHWEDELKQKIKDFGDAKDRYIAKLKELDIGTLNDPLDWETLKTMEDKPVWVDPFGAKALHTPGWGLVGNTSFTTWEGVQCCAIVKVGVTYALPVAEYGKTWQAYRKERG